MKKRKFIYPILFILSALILGIYLSLKPWKLYLEHQERANQAVFEMKKVEKERRELLKKQAQLDNPIGREEIARKRGYRKPDEIPIEE